MFLNADRLIKRMDEEGLDGVVAATLPNVHYFAGFWSLALSGFPYEGQCYAVITRDQVTLPAGGIFHSGTGPGSGWFSSKRHG